MLARAGGLRTAGRSRKLICVVDTDVALMLILPLHRPLSRQNFPCVTLLLVLANVLVYFGGQQGDDARLREAQRYYLDSGLARYEVPAYARYVAGRGRANERLRYDRVAPAQRPAYVATATLHDPAFVAGLRDGAGFEDAAARQAWNTLRPAYDLRLERVFTLRHLQRSSEWSPPRMLGAMFLHADPLHLFGNLLFLVALGTLLEGAIGGWRFLALYLLGGFGASAASLAWRWGETGAGLGASGAIAALMGAFCVVWGRRRVRFFYWFAVVFDYVRGPAIALLPIWLGWEVYNLLGDADGGIGFDAHAGGLLSGALLGALLVATGQRREAFMREEESAAPDTRWARAQQHLGRMDNAAAERLLCELAAEQPHRLDVAHARYRAARNAGDARGARARAAELLRGTPKTTAEAGLQVAVLRELAADGIARDPLTRAQLFERWLATGQLREAETLLRQAGADGARDAQARDWFRLALQHAGPQDAADRRRLLGDLVARYPEQPQAEKARFLLANA